MISWDLVSHMYGFADKPTSKLCTSLAQRLILKYPFMKDSKGTGYVSFLYLAWILCTLPIYIAVTSYRVHGNVSCVRGLAMCKGSENQRKRVKVMLLTHRYILYLCIFVSVITKEKWVDFHNYLKP